MATRTLIADRPAAYASSVLHTLERLFPIVDKRGFAEPWRRLVAAALDVCLMLAAALAALAASYQSSSAVSVRFDAVLMVAVPIAIWCYTLVGWSIGTTVGMYIVGIRIARLDGSRPGPAVAARRIAGFVIATFPIKIGLLPILTHPSRQGWHDRIAGTVVLRRSQAAPLPQPKQTPVASAPGILAPPDLLAAARWWPVPLVLYVLLACIETYPVCMHLGTRMAGFSGDNWQYVWSNWFIGRALRTHTSQIATNMVFYPARVSLLFHTMAWLDCYIAQPLLPVLGSIRTYNAIMLASLSLSAMSAYWFVCSLTRCRPASFVAGAVYGLSPFFLSHALGHAHVYSAEFLPLATMFLYTALTRRQARYALAGGVLAAIQTLAGWEFLVYAIVSAAVLSIMVWLVCGRKDAVRLAASAAIFLAVAAVCLSPLLVPALIQQHDSRYMNRAGESALESATLFGYIAVPELSPIVDLGPERRLNIGRMDVEDQVTPGLAVLALVAASLFWRRRLYIWQMTLLIAFVLSLGPFLTTGYGDIPIWISLIAFGFPGTGFGLPWHAGELVTTAQSITTMSGSPLTQSYICPLPFAFLQQVLPFLRPMRDPARFDTIVLLMCSVVSGFVLCRLFERAVRIAGAAAGFAALAVALASMIVEYVAAPYPTCSAAPPPALVALGRIPDHLAVVDAPLMADPIYMYYQTLHHRPILVGYLSRAPDSAFDFVNSHPILQILTGAAPDAGSSPQQQENARMQIADLKRDGIGYVVVHKDLVGGRTQALAALLHALGLRELFQDSNTIVYRL